jgi:hypothetical protein
VTSGGPETRERSADSSSWWTPRRTKLAGIGSLVGGVGGLAGSFGGLGLVGMSLGDTGIGITPGTVIILYPVWHILLAVGALAANAWYGTRYGRRGRIVAVLLTLSLLGEAGTILVVMVGRTALGELLVPIGVLHATTYMAIRFFGSLYGISLWQCEGVSRLTAGLFVALFPAIFVLAPLTQVGFPGVLIGAPLDLAFIALGYELWTGKEVASGRETEVMG